MTKDDARHAIFTALFNDRNEPGQDWMCPPDWTGHGFDYVADLAIAAIAEHFDGLERGGKMES